VLGGVLTVVVVLLGSGCGEDVQQQAARELLAMHLRSHSEYKGPVHCTDAAKQAFTVQQRTVRFICAARLAHGGCDWWRVDLLARDRATFRRYRADAGCTLPV
jgi:hypothetical protein